MSAAVVEWRASGSGSGRTWYYNFQLPTTTLSLNLPTSCAVDVDAIWRIN